MDIAKKIAREELLIDTAIVVFDRLGYKNAKMEDIASEANITKVTLYAYFQNKENLYLAITYRAICRLIDYYQAVIDDKKYQNNAERSLGILSAFFDFVEKESFFMTAILEYFSIIRENYHYKTEYEAMEYLNTNKYYIKVQEIQNQPIKMAAAVVQAGLDEGSIKKIVHPMKSTLFCWIFIVGYYKISSSNPGGNPILRIPLTEIKNLLLHYIKKFFDVKIKVI